MKFISDKINLFLFFLTLALAILEWVLFKKNSLVEIKPFYFGVYILPINIFLAWQTYEKLPQISYFLFALSLFLQILNLIYLKYSLQAI